MGTAAHMYRGLTAIIVSYEHETADWLDEDDIDMIGLTVHSTALEYVVGFVSIVHKHFNNT